MANLDTRSKRASSVGIGLLFTLAPVLPDGAISQGDRQHIALSYSGILASAFVGLTYLVNLYAQPSPTLNLDAQLSPALNIKAQPSPSLDLESN